MRRRMESPRKSKRGGRLARIGALRWLATQVRPWTGRLAMAFAAMLLSGAVTLLLPATAGRVVDAAVVERSLDQLEGVILALLGLFAFSALLNFFQTYVLRSAAARMLRELRARLHGHLLSLPPSFFERERVGDLLSRLGSDVSAIGDVLTRNLVGGLQQALVLLGALVILIVLHPRLTGVMLLAVPPVVVAAMYYGRRIQRLAREQQKRLAEANVTAEEAFSGIRTVQAFGREELERGRYSLRLAQLLDMALRTARAWGAMGALVSFSAFGALTLVLWYGGNLVITGELTAGGLTSFLLYTFTVASSIGGVLSTYAGLRSAAGSTDRLRELLETRSEIADPPQPIALGRPRGEIEFRAVRFAYPTKPDIPAIDGLSLHIRPGEVVALAGPSGGGKSTLAMLLMRFHDPQAGEVRLDGIDVRRVALRELRAAIGLVPQEIFLFGGTVAENIRYGRPDASDEELREAARGAQAHAFIEILPHGYDTLVGERGVRLSAGERQRIAIARVLLEDPAVVVLDEATSSLDAESEHLVQRAFEHLLRGRTTLVIAHRLSTVRRADRVVILDRGRISEQGSHAELFESDGLYRRLCELQML
jgi:ABC transporter fused permease/ATP-binding protein